MPWAGGVFTRTNGTYSGAAVWQSDAAAAVKIRADRHDTHDQDISQGINNCLAKDGQNSPSNNISWGNFKITNLANGALAGDAVNKGQLDLMVPLTGGAMTGALTNSATITSGTTSGELRVGGQTGVEVGAVFRYDGQMAASTGGVAGVFKPIAKSSNETFTGSGDPTALSGYAVSASGSFGGGYALVDGGDKAHVYMASGAMIFDINNSASLVGKLSLNGTGVRIGSGISLSKLTLSSAAPGALANGELYLRY